MTIAPGEIITIFGAGIGPSQLTSGYDAANNVFATSAAETQVLFDNVAAPIIYAYTGQTAVVAPYSLGGKSSTQVIVSYRGVLSAAATVPVVNFVPGIFTANASGSGQAAVENHDYSLNSSSNPEQRGNFVQVFMTVGGENGVDGAMATGAVPDRPLPTATVGGENAQVIYAGPSPGSVWGLTQVDVSIPGDLAMSGAVPLTITYGGVTSQANVTIAVAALAASISSVKPRPSTSPGRGADKIANALRTVATRQARRLAGDKLAYQAHLRIGTSFGAQENALPPCGDTAGASDRAGLEQALDHCLASRSVVRAEWPIGFTAWITA